MPLSANVVKTACSCKFTLSAWIGPMLPLVWVWIVGATVSDAGCQQNGNAPSTLKDVTWSLCEGTPLQHASCTSRIKQDMLVKDAAAARRLHDKPHSIQKIRSSLLDNILRNVGGRSYHLHMPRKTRWAADVKHIKY